MLKIFNLTLMGLKKKNTTKPNRLPQTYQKTEIGGSWGSRAVDDWNVQRDDEGYDYGVTRLVWAQNGEG